MEQPFHSCAVSGRGRDGKMAKMKMTREEECERLSKPENQEPQGPARRRKRSTSVDIPQTTPADEPAGRHTGRTLEVTTDERGSLVTALLPLG